MNDEITVTKEFHVRRGQHFRKILEEGAKQENKMPGRVPRISRLMALAIKMQCHLASGDVDDYADLARLNFVSRARMTQIMDFLLLAPDIQEDILFLPRVEKCRDEIGERDIRKIVATLDWRKQRKMWRDCCK
jgi:hypothetical protein